MTPDELADLLGAAESTEERDLFIYEHGRDVAAALHRLGKLERVLRVKGVELTCPLRLGNQLAFARSPDPRGSWRSIYDAEGDTPLRRAARARGEAGPSARRAASGPGEVISTWTQQRTLRYENATKRAGPASP